MYDGSFDIQNIFLRNTSIKGLLLHRHALRKVTRLVHIAASADGYVVGEELEGDYFEDGEQEFVGDGMLITRFTSWRMCSSPSMAVTRPGVCSRMSAGMPFEEIRG